MLGKERMRRQVLEYSSTSAANRLDSQEDPNFSLTSWLMKLSRKFSGETRGGDRGDGVVAGSKTGFICLTMESRNSSGDILGGSKMGSDFTCVHGKEVELGPR